MKRVGILSDTHGYWDERFTSYFKECDEIWHAGDIGSYSVADKLNNIAMLRAVYGNCDGYDIRRIYPEINRFKIENSEVLIKHIGGYPGRYDKLAKQSLVQNTPNLFVCGHSHILKVQYDKEFNMLYINPGAAGLQGWQQFRTLILLTVEGDKFSELDVVEIPKSSVDLLLENTK